jgi:hypothetical protein
VISHYYRTATPNDCFVSDASAAGYMNPNRIQEEYLPRFVTHSSFYFRLTDMSIAAMVLDWDQRTDAVKGAFVQFAPNGYSTIVQDLHGEPFQQPTPHVWKGMPVMNLVDYVYPEDVATTADGLAARLRSRPADAPSFHIWRAVWQAPSTIVRRMEALRQRHPDIDFEVVDPYTLLDLFRKHQRPDGE